MPLGFTSEVVLEDAVGPNTTQQNLCIVGQGVNYNSVVAEKVLKGSIGSIDELQNGPVLSVTQLGNTPVTNDYVQNTDYTVDTVDTPGNINWSANDVLLPPTFNAPTQQAGGSFAANTYYWVVTAVNGNGETIASTQATLAVSLNNEVLLSWNTIAGATSYNLYRSTSSGSYVSPALVATGIRATNYTDTGAALSAGAPPNSSTAYKQPVPGTYYYVTYTYLKP